MNSNKVEKIKISGLSSAIPHNIVTYQNTDLPVSLSTQTASDLAYEAARNILQKKSVDLEEIGALIFLTTTPDYRSPATAMVLQKRLGIGRDCIVYDINSGGSGFGHGLQVGSLLLSSISKKYALVLFGDTPSKQFQNLEENEIRLVDAASALLLEKEENSEPWHFLNFTSSEDFEKYILKGGGYRNSTSQGDMEPYTGLSILSPLEIDMDFLVKKQQELIPHLLFNYGFNKKSSKLDFILYSHHGSESFKNIQEKLNLESEKTATLGESFGIPLGSHLPLLIEKCIRSSSLEGPFHFLLVAFGEGLSVSLAQIVIDPSVVVKCIKTDSSYLEGSVTHEM